jgi:type II secretory pathway component GspD/PulD (secretin)
VQVTTSQFFVSDLQPVVGTASAGFDPQLSPLREGVVLDVEGTVSADRRYVTMTVLTTLAKILDISTTPVPIVVGGEVVQSDDANILSQTAFIERPQIQISRVNTTVTVPDRGTILLGGQSIRNDIEIETGVPVLSKMPVLNRFFTNRLMTTEERTLFILIRPTVIIQQEEEDRHFPGLQDTLQGSTGVASQF